MKPVRWSAHRIALALVCGAAMIATALVLSRTGLSDTIVSLLIYAWLVPFSFLLGERRPIGPEWRCLRRRLRALTGTRSSP